MLETAKSYIKKTQDFRHYTIPSLAEEKLYIAVIYIAGNNINFKNAGSFNLENPAENIINTGEQTV